MSAADRPWANPEPPSVNGHPDAHEPLDDPRVIRAVQEYLAAIEAGQRPDRQEFLARHAALAGALAGCLDALEFVHAVGPRLEESAAGEAPPLPAPIDPAAPLGDFRIVREVGRGGMGVVYEAEQLSLGRRIALKVLPFALTLDPRQLQRFKNEAQAAAHLHHSHIVPVYAVGCERGVHFYAMQFIEGQTLAEVIRDLRRLAGREGAADEPTGPYPPPAPAAPAAETADPSGPAAATERSTGTPRFFQTAARWGVQAAEALEHAHQLGVVHRDVKPGNLLVDVRAHLWMTDFGLARLPGNAALTTTGDVVGTLRYMSPEQALARRGLVDHRTDVYALGATLYELLTLEPVFDGRDREELLRQIAFEEPRRPRRLNPATPADLETIVLKALAKGVEERYATAGELADDLRRFLGHEPILARRPTPRERAAKWVRRHTGAVAAAAALLLTAVVGLTASTVLVAREQAHTKEANAQLVEEQARTRAALDAEAEARVRAEENFRQAREVVDFFARESDRGLRDRPALQELRRKLLEAALSYYRDFVEQSRDDPALSAELTASLFRVAHILKEIGARADAQAALEQARVLREDFLRAHRPSLAFGLLGQPAVQDDLGLSEEERQRVARLAKERRTASWEVRRLDSQEARARIDGLAAQEKALVAGLAPEQARRLKQIALQLRGAHAFGDAEVAGALGLTPEQREQVRAIEEGARRSMGGPPRPGGPHPEWPRSDRLKDVSVDLLAVLTPDQEAKWKELTGEPLKGEVWPGLGGPFGPGRGFPRHGRP
jgi:serine/threonine protein kinase